MYEEKRKINYYDLDSAGRVKLSALLKMVHIAADENATALGIGFAEMSRREMSFILQRFAVLVARMPEYGEVVTLRTWPASIARGTFLRKGDMFDLNGKKIMEWASLWILFDIAARKILKPSALPVTLPEFADHGVSISPEKIILPNCEKISSHKHTVRHSDVDTNQHMNNSIYGDIIGNALPPSHIWREMQINYLAETRLGQEIEVAAHNHSDTIFITGNTSAKLSFVARVV